MVVVSPWTSTISGFSSVITPSRPFRTRAVISDSVWPGFIMSRSCSGTMEKAEST